MKLLPRILPRLAVLALAMALAACQSVPWQGFPEAPAGGPVWPMPPQTPRVAWLMQIRQHTDLFTEGGGLHTLKTWITGQPDSAMVRPFALALHPDGGLLVTDPGRARVHFFDWSRRRYRALGPEREGGLPSPVGVCVLRDGRILVSDSRLGLVLAYDRLGAPLGDWVAAGVLGRPAGMAADPQTGEVFVADVTAHQIAVFDESGRLLRRLGKCGDGLGEFNYPTHLALTPGGNLIVTDSMNFRVQEIRPDGTGVQAIGTVGSAPGSFSKPKGVAVDAAGNIIAVEGLYDAVQFFSPSGALLLSIGGSGAGPGQFWLPAGACMDRAKGLLFIADSYNSRVQVFHLLEGTP